MPRWFLPDDETHVRVRYFPETKRMTCVSDPIAETDAANRRYVDQLFWKGVAFSVAVGLGTLLIVSLSF